MPHSGQRQWAFEQMEMLVTDCAECNSLLIFTGPEIEGLHSFGGHIVHSAAWNGRSSGLDRLETLLTSLLNKILLIWSTKELPYSGLAPLPFRSCRRSRKVTCAVLYHRHKWLMGCSSCVQTCMLYKVRQIQSYYGVILAYKHRQIQHVDCVPYAARERRVAS